MWLLQIMMSIEQEQCIYIVYHKSILYTAGSISWVENAAYPANQVTRAKQRLGKQVFTNFWKNGKIRSTEVENGR